MQDEGPLDFWSNFGSPAQSLQRLLAQLRVQDHERRVVGEEKLCLEIGRLRCFEEGVDWRLRSSQCSSKTMGEEALTIRARTAMSLL
jgi:hypothetical protein